MSYADGYPVRPIAGRLVLNFLNTADWSADGVVVHEKLVSLLDLDRWKDAVGLESTSLPDRISEALNLRASLRSVFVTGMPVPVKRDAIEKHLLLIKFRTSDVASSIKTQRLLSLIANSALAVLADPHEMSRLKLCPGHNCGWLFIDETKNARRRWCMMETCGNRAKASRHHARKGTKPRR